VLVGAEILKPAAFYQLSQSHLRGYNQFSPFFLTTSCANGWLYGPSSLALIAGRWYQAMTTTSFHRQPTDLTAADRERLPTMYDLPSENPEEPGLPDEFHDYQPELLSITLQLADYAADNWCTAKDLNLYYDVDHPRWYKRPDWFLAVGVPRFYDHRDLRLSYVIWQEQVSPFVVVELLSPGTHKEDLGQTQVTPDGPPTKWTVYEQILRVPYYVLFDRYTDNFQAFHLEAGQYQAIDLTETNNRLWIPELKVGLAPWQGRYKHIDRLWLRWYDEQGHWLPTPSEQAEQAQQRALQAQQEAGQAQQRAEAAETALAQLKRRLKAQGIDPDTL
jgi:Uma2 family endonuclease